VLETTNLRKNKLPRLIENGEQEKYTNFAKKITMDLSLFQPILDFFTNLSVVRVIDILLVLYLLYELYNFIKGTAGINIFFGIIALYIIWKLVIYLEMPLLSEIMGQFISVGVIAIIIVFQQEIRKFLLLLGNPKFINKTRRRFLFWRFTILQDNTLEITPLIRALKSMSATKTGALIVLTRKNELEDIVNTGIKVDSYISEHMLESVFYKNAPLHDGAIIITDNRIIAAKCILPVSDNEKLPQNAGLRHRAAMGISEVSDAITIVVSEQTGKIAVAVGGELRTEVLTSDLREYLELEFAPKKQKK
jgi:diadenylate cyclase